MMGRTFVALVMAVALVTLWSVGCGRKAKPEPRRTVRSPAAYSIGSR